MNDIVLPARSRFRVESLNLADLGSYVTDVVLDYYSKSVVLKVLDVILNGKPVVHDWIIDTLNNPGKERFIVHQHDANGNVLYKKVLKGIKLIGHVCNHDYSSEGNDLQDHELWFSYEELQVVTNLN